MSTYTNEVTIGCIEYMAVICLPANPATPTVHKFRQKPVLCPWLGTRPNVSGYCFKTEMFFSITAFHPHVNRTLFNARTLKHVLCRDFKHEVKLLKLNKI